MTLPSGPIVGAEVAFDELTLDVEGLDVHRFDPRRRHRRPVQTCDDHHQNDSTAMMASTMNAQRRSAATDSLGRVAWRGRRRQCRAHCNDPSRQVDDEVEDEVDGNDYACGDAGNGESTGWTALHDFVDCATSSSLFC